ncbi:MAG: hypothetical protein IKT56_05175 [Clostridia bacterium]|nr:hypothetical protein [Clostridia bacterium]
MSSDSVYTERGSLKERRMFFKWEARRTITENGNLLRFIFSLFIMLLICFALIFFVETVCIFAGARVGIYFIMAEWFLLFLVGAPLYVGLLRMAYLMSSRRPTDIPDMLWAFSGGRLRNVYKVSLNCLSVFAAKISISCVIGCLALCVAGFSPVRENNLLSVEALTATVLIFPLLSGMFPRSFVLPTAFFENENESFGYVLDIAKKSVRRHGGEIFLLKFSFFPLFVLSILSFGILFFIYFLPFYMFTTQLCASYFTGCVTVENYRK